MKLLNWDSSVSVGVKEIDVQHEKIFEIINRLYENMKEGSVKEKLTDYSSYHFSTEEKYFLQFDYPDKDSHRKVHQVYKEKIAELIKTSPDRGMSTSYEILDFLENWWFGHINGIDKQYTAFFNEHGLN